MFISYPHSKEWGIFDGFLKFKRTVVPKKSSIFLLFGSKTRFFHKKLAFF